ncbi:hypothetical protein Natpe_3530 [Natrinema pellirubrum DSM 15624]|uniref:Uncharacterized protein n=1 Tax=Natrinema pellirubrum (strain DSM 15624 / CIP 106293 / JCM 10476 / NCIMB 786 / 157) TaxID=797303 RepID=L0JP66_NATP1|nr:hypothetical protein Natpe_3530 [Natrinema pellirubrum DSM 15624]
MICLKQMYYEQITVRVIDDHRMRSLSLTVGFAGVRLGSPVTGRYLSPYTCFRFYRLCSDPLLTCDRLAPDSSPSSYATKSGDRIRNVRNSEVLSTSFCYRTVPCQVATASMFERQSAAYFAELPTSRVRSGSTLRLTESSPRSDWLHDSVLANNCISLFENVRHAYPCPSIWLASNASPTVSSDCCDRATKSLIRALWAGRFDANSTPSSSRVAPPPLDPYTGETTPL